MSYFKAMGVFVGVVAVTTVVGVVINGFTKTANVAIDNAVSLVC
jgi:hypothetical protein